MVGGGGTRRSRGCGGGVGDGESYFEVIARGDTAFCHTELDTSRFWHEAHRFHASASEWHRGNGGIIQLYRDDSFRIDHDCHGHELYDVLRKWHHRAELFEEGDSRSRLRH